MVSSLSSRAKWPVSEVKLHVGKVALVGICAIGGEDLVVLAPHDQRGRLVLAEICLNRRIQWQIGEKLEDVHLNIGVARPVEQRRVMHPVCRTRG